ncbi:MAG: single-stranded DNA-binding protein [Clostridiaceae bacterium]|nr:single-stranded DNA-binding protein [Clostridiaceae bacterium]
MSLNTIYLLGRLTHDPEMRYGGNTSICKFKIAVNRPGKAQEGQPNADFFQLTAFGKTAEFITKYFTKGQQILIVGYLRNNNWTDQQGNKHYDNAICVEKVYFADSKRESIQAPEQTEGYYSLDESDEDLPF